MNDYVTYIREKVGHDLIFLNCAGGWVENEDGHVLLQKLSPTEEIWGLPGGVMELGESAEETAVREIREETGLEVVVDSLIGVYTHYFDSYPNGDKAQVVAISFRCSIVGGELYADMKETFGLAFFDPEHLPELINQHHKDLADDAINGRIGVYR